MIFVLEYCLENPKSIFSVIPKDFETVRENFPFLKRKVIATYFGFHPSSLNVLKKKKNNRLRGSKWLSKNVSKFIFNSRFSKSVSSLAYY